MLKTAYGVTFKHLKARIQCKISSRTKFSCTNKNLEYYLNLVLQTII